jgi:hypothetical protein
MGLFVFDDSLGIVVDGYICGWRVGGLERFCLGLGVGLLEEL